MPDFNPTEEKFAKPYDSNQGFTSIEIATILLISVIFFSWLWYKVKSKR